MFIFDCIIVGAGPAGLSASIYLQRANKKILLIEKSAPGGQIIKTSIIENYPGCEKIEGTTLATNMFNQAINLGVNYEYGDLKEIKLENNLYKVITDTNQYLTKKIIIATGRNPRKLNLNNEEKLLGHGVSYCATCDGYLYKNKVVGVVGAGNTAYEETLYLSKICKHVYMFNRRENIRADNILQNEIHKCNNIEIFNNTEIAKINDKDNIISSVVTNTGKTYDLSCLFIFVGQVPSKIKFDKLNTVEDYIIVDSNMKTNLSGVYACGDAIKKDFYQISIAVGEGAIAALNIIKELKN